MHVLQPHNKCINGNERKLLIILSPQCESDMGIPKTSPILFGSMAPTKKNHHLEHMNAFHVMPKHHLKYTISYVIVLIRHKSLSISII
jgi:hypothetical protein